MARVTVEDSLREAKNRFALVLLVIQRTKQLFKGSKPLSERKGNKEIVTALREIAEGKVSYAHLEYLLSQDSKRVEANTETVSDEEKTEQ
jgi:DNA-directed RNA polymerase subunit omega